MAKTKRISLQKRIEQLAFEKLTVQAYTMQQLADTIGENYYTVRKAIKRMEDQGLVQAKHHRANTMIYSLVEPDAKHPNNSMPTIAGYTGPLKIIGVLNNVGKEDKSVTAIAAIALPRTVARILMAALRNVESNGSYDIDTNLNNIRTELMLHADKLRIMLKHYEAVLQADVLWDSNKIKAIPYDHDFDKQAVIDAYRYYYPED